MGKEKIYVNIKKSYEVKHPTDVQHSDNFTDILREITVSFKECGESKSCEQ